MYIDRLPLNERTSNKANIDLHILSKWNLRGLCQTRGTKRPGLGHPFLDASRFIFVTWTSALHVVRKVTFWNLSHAKITSVCQTWQSSCVIYYLYVPTQSSLFVMVGSLHAANFIPNKCKPHVANTKMRTSKSTNTRRISLNPLHSSTTTRLIWGTRMRMRKGRQHL